MKKTKYTPQAGDVCEWNGREVMVCYSFKIFEEFKVKYYRIMLTDGTYNYAAAKYLKLIYRP